MNDEKVVLTTVYACPECQNPIREVGIRPEGGGEYSEVTYECSSCRKTFAKRRPRVHASPLATRATAASSSS